MEATHLLDDLYRYNDWANHRILQLCQGLTVQQLDMPRELGLGSLRNTLFHILAAEQIWLERWSQAAWRPFPLQPNGESLEQITAQLAHVSEERRQLMDRERSSDWSGRISYLDAKKNAFENPLKTLLLHVANHGIHHRAQALSYLKSFGKMVAGGLDYLFYKLAKPTLEQQPATIDAFRQYGLEMQSGQGHTVAFDGPTIQSYFAYGDWANQTLLELSKTLSDSALDCDYAMGQGTIRKNFLHLLDAERWWLTNWQDPKPWPSSDASLTLNEWQSQWHSNAMSRNEFIQSLDQDAAQRVVTVQVGGHPVGIRVIESLIQLCGHGTHHRAQIINMLRRSGVTAPGMDYIAWIRRTS